MDRGECPAGSLQGFPISLPDNAFTMKATTSDPLNLWKETGQEFDFSVNWSADPPTAWAVSISRSSDSTPNSQRFFSIIGFSDIANNTTLVYGGANYVCDDRISICNAQHANLLLPFMNPQRYPYEAILMFRLQNPDANPTLPAIILLCRPFLFSETFRLPGWNEIASAVTAQTPPTTTFHPKKLFTFQDDLVPMVAYETCLNARVSTPQQIRPTSIRVRVCVGCIPMDIPANTNLQAKCDNIPKFRFSPNITRLFTTGASVQFKQSTTGSYPAQIENNFFPLQTASTITSDSLASYVEVLVPSAMYGQDPAAIADGTAKKKPQRRIVGKCYRVDPEKDIRNGQIMIDPSTGQPLSDTLRQESIDAAGGDIELARALQGQPPENPGILPGDVQYGLLIAGIALGSLIGVSLFCYIFFLFFYRKDYRKAGVYTLVFLILGVVLGVLSWVFAEKESKK